MTAQHARQLQARAMVLSWVERDLTRNQVLERLNRYASNPAHLHLTPHLLTEAREASLIRSKVGT